MNLTFIPVQMLPRPREMESLDWAGRPGRPGRPRDTRGPSWWMRQAKKPNPNLEAHLEAIKNKREHRKELLGGKPRSSFQVAPRAGEVHGSATRGGAQDRAPGDNPSSVTGNGTILVAGADARQGSDKGQRGERRRGQVRGAVGVLGARLASEVAER